MKSVAATPVAQATLFDIYAPLERYFHELGPRQGAGSVPPVRLQPEDAYLLHVFVDLHSSIRAVVDLAGEATWGATTVLWASRERGCPVYTPEAQDQPKNQAWTAALQDCLGSLDPSASVAFVPHDQGGSNIADLLSRVRVGNQPVLVVVALSSEDACGPATALATIFAAHPGALALVLPLGLVGEDRHVDELLEWTHSNDLRLTALRDLSPFLAASRLAVVGAKHDTELEETLKRIQRLFTSNFDFLTLARQAYTVHRANAKLETQLQQAKAKSTELERVLREREGLMHGAQMKIEELDQSAQGWARECEQIAAHALRLQSQLREATSGRSWSLVQRLRRLRPLLIPQNSLRERWGCSVMRIQRRLRGWMRPAR